DSFTYRARDGQLNSSAVTVSLNVVAVNSDPQPAALPNVAPVAVNDIFVATRDASLVVNARGVLANDRDGNGDALTATIASQPQHGKLTLNADGSFEYVPDPHFVGADRFTYRASDASASSAVAAT